MPSSLGFIDFCRLASVLSRYTYCSTEKDIGAKNEGIISKIGNHTLGFIKAVAHDITVESAKQAVYIMLHQPPQ